MKRHIISTTYVDKVSYLSAIGPLSMRVIYKEKFYEPRMLL